MAAVLGLAELAMTRPVTLVKSAALAPNLHVLTLASDHFSDVHWEPGQKVDVQIGKLAYRAYTPCRLDKVKGELDLLVFRHGQGPGSQRLCELPIGETLRLRGPKDSTNINELTGKLAIFGDETSIALMIAHQAQDPEFDGQDSILETNAASPLRQTLKTLGLGKTIVMTRQELDEHLNVAASTFSGFLDKAAENQVVLSGRAASVQMLRKKLISFGIQKSKLITHAFWAEGKVALG